MFRTQAPRNTCKLALRYCASRHFASEAAAKRTALYDLHVEHGGKMVPFAGWSMPIQYGDFGVLASVKHTRQHASLFDVSHMLQSRLTGKHRVEFLEALTVADVKEIPTNSATLSVFTNEQGGIIDDTIISNQGDHFYVVSNAGCADKDTAHIQKHLKTFKAKGKDVNFQILTDMSLVAIQGPSAVKVVEQLSGETLSNMKFMSSKSLSLNAVPCLVARSGYTGEDGFEIQIPSKSVSKVAKAMLSNPEVKWAGLGARDSLRLEAGMCLYGHDLDDTTTPVEAGLLWTIGKRRRAEGGFLGSDVILPQIKGGVERKRVGFIVEGAPAREGATISSKDGETIGKITSGGPSPCLGKNIAMGYIKTGFHKSGTEVNVAVRNRTQKATVTKMPFVETRYYKGLL